MVGRLMRDSQHSHSQQTVCFGIIATRDFENNFSILWFHMRWTSSIAKVLQTTFGPTRATLPLLDLAAICVSHNQQNFGFILSGARNCQLFALPPRYTYIKFELSQIQIIFKENESKSECSVWFTVIQWWHPLSPLYSYLDVNNQLCGVILFYVYKFKCNAPQRWTSLTRSNLDWMTSSAISANGPFGGR